VGFAIGVVVLLLGIVVGWAIVVLGAVLAIGFGFLWVRDLAAGHEDLTHAPEVEPETRTAARAPAIPTAPDEAAPELVPSERYSRSMFLGLSTLGLGAVIGGIVTVPALGFMIGPAFLKQGRKDVDIGPLENFPEGQYVVTTFMESREQGDVSRRTAFIRNNGATKNGPVEEDKRKEFAGITLVPTIPAGFGCPCHGGQYDTEGNRTAGPPVRALDRYAFSIRNNHLFIGKPFSVSHVEGAGADARIMKWAYAFPGEHVDGIESWLYPIQPPH
jgi:menaquinol-cytochrome c reductase iron-sulfur subunit